MHRSQPSRVTAASPARVSPPRLPASAHLASSTTSSSITRIFGVALRRRDPLRHASCASLLTSATNLAICQAGSRNRHGCARCCGIWRGHFTSASSMIASSSLPARCACHAPPWSSAAHPVLSRCSPDRCPNSCIASRRLPPWEASIADGDVLLRDPHLSALQREALQAEQTRKRRLIAPLTATRP